MLQEYRKHVEERADEGLVPKPLNAEQVAQLIELVKNPPAGEEELLLKLDFWRRLLRVKQHRLSSAQSERLNY